MVKVPPYVHVVVYAPPFPSSQRTVIVLPTQSEELDDPAGAEYPLSHCPDIPWSVVSLNV